MKPKERNEYILKALESYKTLRTPYSEVQWIMLKLCCTEKEAVKWIEQARKQKQLDEPA